MSHHISVAGDLTYADFLGNPVTPVTRVEAGITADGTNVIYVTSTGEYGNSHHSPASIRELAFGLLDLADLAEIQAGGVPTDNPFAELTPIELEGIAYAMQARAQSDQF